MPRTLFLTVPESFSFKSTIYSHGWCELAPFEIDEENWRLSYVFSDGDRVSPGVIFERSGKLCIELGNAQVADAIVIKTAKHLLRLDEDLEDFYCSIDDQQRLAWVREKRAGRLLRSATVFEDLVKTICTTNCSWSLTKSMVSNLVEKLGSPAGGGKMAFPTAAAMAAVSADFYRDEIRAGYRSPYFAELAESVASGSLDPESWLTSDLPTAGAEKRDEKGKRRWRLCRREPLKTRRPLRRPRPRFLASFAILQKPQCRQSMPRQKDRTPLQKIRQMARPRHLVRHD